MENAALAQLRERLMQCKGKEQDYRIPSLWNASGFLEVTEVEGGELALDPAAFFVHAIESIENAAFEYQQTPWQSDLRTHGIYAALIRSLTAWDHHDKDVVEPGTFVKALALLPYIRSLGYDIIYLLPVFAGSDSHKKGSAGSPYAVRDFFSLDASQHDPLLGDYDEALLDLQFAAFVEAAHKMGMRVMVDFVYRTCARDHCWIREHPDWFYWIDAHKQEQFAPIHVDSLPPLAPTQRGNMQKMYADPKLLSYVSLFRLDPRSQDAQRFAQLCEQVGDDALLSAIEEEFGITTAPAFSDVINDPQPPWSDVTYLRLDMGQNELARQYIPPSAPPCILNDGMKMSNFPPGQLNEALCARLVDMIPNCQKKYGIDGARLDMGHALPRPLLEDILRAARQDNPAFMLWSEVFDADASYDARREGYDMISGTVWMAYPHRQDADFNRRFMLPLLRAALPSVAALSLPDSPRAAIVIPAAQERRDALVFNALLPNAIPFMTAGCEWGEPQPMNLGLGDHGTPGLHILPDDDPMQGKLAFFDIYRMHWTQADLQQLECLRSINAQRRDLAELYCAEEGFVPREVYQTPSSHTGFSLEDARRRLTVCWQRSLYGNGKKEGAARLLYRSGADMNEHGISGGLMVVLEEKQ